MEHRILINSAIFATTDIKFFKKKGNLQSNF